MLPSASDREWVSNSNSQWGQNVNLGTKSSANIDMNNDAMNNVLTGRQ